jgi:nitroreductase
MSEILKIIQERQSARVPFDPDKPVSKEDLMQILEAARWAPTAHNMQNFDIIVVDDKAILEKIGSIKSAISEEFLCENLEQLSFTKEELLKRKTGVLGTNFPPAWRDPSQIAKVARETSPAPLFQRLRGSPTLLLVVYDSRKRAPASHGDVLGLMSLGCVMENMWLMAEALGINLQILSAFSAPHVEKETKKLLGVPDYMKIAYTCRLGYPTGTAKYFRVRRDIQDFVHHNRFGNKGLGKII